MPIRDILLQLNSYPEPSPPWAIEAAGQLADRLGAMLSVGLCRVFIPEVSNFLANLLVDADEAIAAENRKSAHNAQKLLDRFSSSIGPERRGESITIDCPGLVTPWRLATKARAYDLVIVPRYGHGETRAVAEGLVFDAGRPVLLLPPAVAEGPALDRVVIGWDGSRAAARAVSDSLAICAQARTVILARVTGEKDLSQAEPVSDMVRHLSLHGIVAEPVLVPIRDDQDAGLALIDHCGSTGANLLVMGAYGHSRAREFVLGGATRSVLQETEIPLLLSH